MFTNVSVSNGMILDVWQAEGARARIYHNLPISAKVGSAIVITLFLKVELNKTPEGSNIDANRKWKKKLSKRNIERMMGKEQNQWARGQKAVRAYFIAF